MGRGPVFQALWEGPEELSTGRQIPQPANNTAMLVVFCHSAASGSDLIPGPIFHTNS